MALMPVAPGTVPSQHNQFLRPHPLHLSSPSQSKSPAPPLTHTPIGLRCPRGVAASPMRASFRLDSTGRMFFSTSSMGPGRWAIFSLRSSASRALFSFSCLACRDGSAEVSARGREWSEEDVERGLGLPWGLQSSLLPSGEGAETVRMQSAPQAERVAQRDGSRGQRGHGGRRVATHDGR